MTIRVPATQEGRDTLQAEPRVLINYLDNKPHEYWNQSRYVQTHDTKLILTNVK